MLARFSMALARARVVPLGAQAVTLEHMLERTQIRMLPVANRAAEHAPMVTACCNACRVCVQTNALALVLAGIGGATAFAARFAKRIVKPLLAD
jgi:hypothetical protein